MDSRYFGLKKGSGSSSPTSSSRRGRKRSNSSSTNNNIPDEPKPPQRGLGVAQLERLRLQDQLIRNHLNRIGPSGFSNQLLQNPNQGNQWSSQSSYSSPSFPKSLPSSTSPPPPEYRPQKMMKFDELGRANNNPYLGATSKPSTNAPISNMETRPLQNQQGEKDCVQEKRDADWLTLSIGSSIWTESEADADQELDLELKL